MRESRAAQPSIQVAAVFRPADTRDRVGLFLEKIRALQAPAVVGVCLYDAAGALVSSDLPEGLPLEVRRGFWDEDLGRARNDALDMCSSAWALVLDVGDRVVGDVGAALQVLEEDPRKPDVGVVRVTDETGDFRFGRLVRVATVRYDGAEAEFLASAFRDDRRCAFVDPALLSIQRSGSSSSGEGARRPRRLGRLLRDAAVAEATDPEQLPEVLLALGCEHEILGEVPAALGCYARVADVPGAANTVWAACELAADLLLSQVDVAGADVYLDRLDSGPEPMAASWLRARRHLVSGEDRLALALLRRQEAATCAAGIDITDAQILRTRFEVASRVGEQHDMLVALLALMTAGLDIAGRGRQLLRLWGSRSEADLANVIVGAGRAHLEEIADELAATSKIGRRVAAAIRSRRRGYTTAAVVIARDEARCIRRCVESVRPWVDEVVVADTGSEDDTAALAAAAGARVVHVPWTDDFSSARNAALDAAGADWHVVLDADEVVSAGGAELRDLADVVPEIVMAVNVVSTFHLSGRLETEEEPVPRILPGDVRYRGTVHEQPEHEYSTGRVRVTIEHDGYEPAQLLDKLPRRERLLRAAAQAEPTDAYLRYQLARNLETQGRMAEAAAEYDAVDLDGLEPASWHHILVVQKAHTLTSVGRSHEAFDFLLGQADRFNDSADYHFVLGNVLVDLAAERPDSAGEALPLAVQEFRRCLALGEGPGLPGHVRGRGSHLAARNLEVVLEGCRELGIEVLAPDREVETTAEETPLALRNGGLDVVMIVKNEEERLGDALASCAALRPLLGDICVYDTGSTDSTREIARAHGARVVEGYWDDNYSRARNAAAAMSDAPWLLVLDADERLFADPQALALEIGRADRAGIEVLYIEATPTNGSAGAAGEYWMSPRLYRPDLARYARPVHAELRRRDGRRFMSEYHVPRHVLRLENDGFDVDRQQASVQRALHLTEIAQEVRADEADRLAVYVDRARARWGAGDVEGARADLKAATEMTADTTYYRWAFQWLVRLELAAGNIDDAASELDGLRALAPTDSYTRWLEANLLIATGQAEDASRILQGLDMVTDAIGLPMGAEALAETALRAARAAGDPIATVRAIERLANARGDTALADRARRLASS